MDFAGIGPVKDALVTINDLLEKVLGELRRTNDAQLDAVVTELRAVRASVDRLVAVQEVPTPAAS
jgi:Mg2+/Co2+ transporter CorC